MGLKKMVSCRLYFALTAICTAPSWAATQQTSQVQLERPAPHLQLATGGEETGLVTIHPPVAADFVCAEHAVGQLMSKGDALGSDCTVVGGLDPSGGPSAGFMRTHRGNGLRNEDWYGWDEPLLAPFDAIVERLQENPVVNTPGSPGRPPASFIVFKRADGVRVIYAHLQKPTVAGGDKVVAGQAIGRIGNNGFARLPHLHIGAWQGTTPLQIRMDLAAMGRLRALRSGK